MAKKKQKKQKTVRFKTARRPSVKVQIRGRELRKGPKFVDGVYETDDPKEIEELRKKTYIHEVEIEDEAEDENDENDEKDKKDEDDGGDDKDE